MIRAENLWKEFGRFDALRGLSFSVAEGSAFALIGANGAGKTTTIKILMNILEPSRGNAIVLGVDTRNISVAELRQIGYVSENQEMPAKLTVAEYLAYLRSLYPRWDRSLEISLQRQLHLPGERKIGNLSHGMRMKMALACALPFRPKLLVLDEPFSGLDPLVREEVMEGLLRHTDDVTILMSSHELGEIDGLATHVGFLDEGKLLFEESMNAVSARFREVHVILEHEASIPSQFPESWLQLRIAGNVLTFVETRFSDRALCDRVRSFLTGVRSIDVKPMGLRSIFITLARTARDGARS